MPVRIDDKGRKRWTRVVYVIGPRPRRMRGQAGPMRGRLSPQADLRRGDGVRTAGDR
jgi:hypothetical protein